jgi:hypothetical protein
VNIRVSHPHDNTCKMFCKMCRANEWLLGPTTDTGAVELLPAQRAAPRPRLAYDVALRFGGTL